MKQLSYNRERVFKTRQEDMIPKGLLVAMCLFALSGVAIASYASLTGGPRAGVPNMAEPVRERGLILEGNSAQAVTVRAEDGSVLADMAHGGFVTVVQNAVATSRHRHGLDMSLPVRLVEYANGRLVLEDPATGDNYELYAFGSDNKAAFERLLDQ